MEEKINMNIKMKKQFYKIFLGVALAFVLAVPIFVSAAPSAGIKPGSFFYFFDTTFEKINLFLTFNPEKKAQKALEYANERLAEAEAVAEEKNTDAVKTAVAGYESNIALAAEESSQIKDKGKTEELLNSIADNTSKHQEILAEVLNKVPDEAKEAITKAIEVSKKGQEEAMKQIAELKGEVEQLKQEVAELKTQNEEQEKTIGEVSKQKQETKPKSTPTATQKTTSQTSETIATAKPATTSSQTQTQTSEPQNTQPTVQTPSSTTTNKGEWALDTRSGSPDYGKQFWVPTGQTLDQVRPIPTPTPVSVTALEITSVNVTPDVNSTRIEWLTNKPTTAKIFLSGGNLFSKVYSSESGQSTRHITNITGLISNTNYSYEVEAIAGEQVAKKISSFYTKTGELTIQADKTSVQLRNCNYVTITANYTESGKAVPVVISFSAPDSALDTTKTYNIIANDFKRDEYGSIPCGSNPLKVEQSNNSTAGQSGGYCTSDGKVSFYYRPKTLGLHTVSIFAGGVTKTLDIQATEYVKIDPTIQILTLEQNGVVTTNPIIQLKQDPRDWANNVVGIGNFKITQADESTSFNFANFKYESNIPIAFTADGIGGQLMLASINSENYQLKIRPQFYDGISVQALAVGTHTIKLTEIKLRGLCSGELRTVLGLPVTFTYTVQ